MGPLLKVGGFFSWHQHRKGLAAHTEQLWEGKGKGNAP